MPYAVCCGIGICFAPLYRKKVNVFSRFEHLLLDRKVVVLDLKATGKDYKTDWLVQFAALSIEPGDIPRVFASHVNPGIPIPRTATAMHGIHDADVRSSHAFGYFAQDLYDDLADAVLIGYDIKKFALPLLIKEFERCGLTFSIRSRFVIDVLQISREKDPLTLSEAFSVYCGQKLERSELPDQDVDAIAWVLDGQLKQYPDLPRTIAELHDHLATSDLLGLFRYGDGGHEVFNFGKYRGKLLSEVGKTDPDYLRWILESEEEFLEDVREIVKYPLGLAFCE
jgi:DNA polymerase III subunit epsilon